MNVEMSEEELARWARVREAGFGAYVWRYQRRSWLVLAVGVAILAALPVHIVDGAGSWAWTFLTVLLLGNGGRIRMAWARRESAYRFTLARRDAEALLGRAPTR